MPTYPPALLDEIRTGVDIVELIGRFVTLKKAGQNWKGLCPFHAEKTPSFIVNPRKGVFHCFGCGVGGDAFGFLMRQDRLSFPEAVRALARSAGVPLPEESSRTPASDSQRDELFRVMSLASTFYAERLWGAGGERARAYLTQRGIEREVAQRFVLGYAPPGWETLLAFMKAEGVAEDTLVTAGLAVAREHRPGVYDRFRDRLLFAIRDLQGRVVGFGGRALGDDEPKYLNSPETPLYSKGGLLYAIDLAREGMRARNRALLVEGYVDCLMAHQHGFTETVAALGTALTSTQLHLIRRYTDEAVLFFDGDLAGQKAAQRAEALLDGVGGAAFWDPTSGGATWAINRSGNVRTTERLRVRVALLPGGHDPDTFLRSEGAEAFEACIAGARSLVAYALEASLAADAAGGRTNTSGVLARAALTLAKIGDAEEAATVSREVAFKLGLDPVHLLDEARRLQATLRRPVAPEPAPAPRSAPSVPDRDMVGLLLHVLAARQELLPWLDERDVEHPGLRAIVAALRRRPDAPAESVLADLEDDSARNLLAALLVEERGEEDLQASIQQYRRRLAMKQSLRRMRETSRSIAETQAAGGLETQLDAALRRLQQDGREVRSHTLGHPYAGAAEPPRSPDA